MTTPVEEAILSFANVVYRETMGAGRVIEVTLDAVTYDRLAAAIGERVAGHVIDDPFGGPMEYKMMLACAGGHFVYVTRGTR